MSAHRWAYRPEPQRRATTWRATLAAIAVAAVIGAVVIGVSRGAEEVLHRVSGTHDRRDRGAAKSLMANLAAIRAEAFRAGLAEGRQQSCSGPTLDRPMATR